MYNDDTTPACPPATLELLFRHEGTLEMWRTIDPGDQLLVCADCALVICHESRMDSDRRVELIAVDDVGAGVVVNATHDWHIGRSYLDMVLEAIFEAARNTSDGGL